MTDLLAAGDYARLERLTGGVRLGAGDIARAVADYGRTMVPLPDAAYDDLDVIEVEGVTPRTWSVNVPLHTREEGRSDLTLELTLIADAASGFRVEFDDLHVL